jgi:RNA polymerase primary sigma factor
VAEEDVDSFEDADDGDEDGGVRATTARLEEMRAEALSRFGQIASGFEELRRAFLKGGFGSPPYLKAQKELTGHVVALRFTAKTVDKLSAAMRAQLDDVRSHEGSLRKLMVERAGMPVLSGPHARPLAVRRTRSRWSGTCRPSTSIKPPCWTSRRATSFRWRN